MNTCHVLPQQGADDDTMADSFACDICDFETNDSLALTTHSQTVHEDHNSSSVDSVRPESTIFLSKTPPPSWMWLGQEGQDQGPFPWFHMLRWFNAGFFSSNTMLKREGDEDYASLEEIQKKYGLQPFGISQPVNRVSD